LPLQVTLPLAVHYVPFIPRTNISNLKTQKNIIQKIAK